MYYDDGRDTEYLRRRKSLLKAAAIVGGLVVCLFGWFSWLEHWRDVRIQEIPQGYFIDDPRVQERDKDWATLRLPLGDNQVIYRHQGQRKTFHVNVSTDDDGFLFNQVVGGREQR